MPEGQASKGKKNRKWGRNRYNSYRCGPAPRKYLDKNMRFENKLHRVRKYNGAEAAIAYDHKYRAQLRESGRMGKKA